VLMQPSLGLLRGLRRRPYTHRVNRMCGWALVLILLGYSGCASFGRRGPAAEKAAECRDLTRQGISAIEMGQWQQAETLLLQAVEASPTDADAHRYLAAALWHRGDAVHAISEIAAAIEAAPEDATLSARAGEMALAMGARDDALGYAETAIRLDPRLAAAWALRGRVFWQLDQPDRALADLQRAIELSPGNSDVLLDIAAIYRQRGQSTRCLTTLQHLREQFTPGEEPQNALVLEGLTLLDLGRPQQACNSLLAATQRSGASAQITYHLAQAQYEAGRYAEATVTAQQALALDSSHAASRQLLTELAAHSSPSEPQRR
jgi:tetratricopeptide (TPR) repeat protein